MPDSCTACMTIVDSTVARSRLELTASPSLAERLQLPDLVGELGAPGLQGAYEVEVAHRYRRSRGESSEERDGPILERIDLGAPYRQHADDLVVEQHRRAHGRAKAGDPLGILAPVGGVGEHVVDLDGAPLETDPAME